MKHINRNFKIPKCLLFSLLLSQRQARPWFFLLQKESDCCPIHKNYLRLLSLAQRSSFSTPSPIFSSSCSFFKYTNKHKNVQKYFNCGQIGLIQTTAYRMGNDSNQISHALKILQQFLSQSSNNSYEEIQQCNLWRLL